MKRPQHSELCTEAEWDALSERDLALAEPARPKVARTNGAPSRFSSSQVDMGGRDHHSPYSVT